MTPALLTRMWSGDFLARNALAKSKQDFKLAKSNSMNSTLSFWVARRISSKTGSVLSFERHARMLHE